MALRSANLNVMMQAAERAGRALVRDFGEVEQLQVSRKGPGDFVSSADRRAEKIIREALQKARPDYGLLLEESGTVEGADEAHRFIVDPLDGTTNFLHGLPHWAVSIALEARGEIVAGVIFDPIKDELFWAERGQGAYQRDRRLRVSARSRLSDSIFATGIPHQGIGGGAAGRALFKRRLDGVMEETAGVRRWGTASLDLAYVAAGRYEGFWERGLKPWDVAAGWILVREAGGFVTDAAGKPYRFDSDDIVAANDRIQKGFLEILKRAG